MAAGTIAIVVAIGGVIAIVVTFSFGLSAASAIDPIFFFLFALLPFLNAVLDWLSWAVTRRLLRAAAAKTKSDRCAPVWLAVELLIDLLFALACLVCLAALLALAFESWNWFGYGDPVDWRAMADMAARAPFTEGILVTGMLATTFVPTLLHLGYGFYGLHLAFAPDQAWIRDVLRRGDPSAGEVSRAARQMMRVRFNLIYAIPAALVVVAGFFALFYYPVQWIFGGYTDLFLGAATGAVEAVFGAAPTAD